MSCPRGLMFVGFAVGTGGMAFWTLAFLMLFDLVPYDRPDRLAALFGAGSLLVSATGALTAKVWATAEEREEDW